MTQLPQLEVPQISLARYFDLLKRRRWQVLPVSVLGLLIGGIVAFFIPRYYVCDTLVQFQGPLLGGGRGDPAKNRVGAWQVSIGQAAEETLAKLGWPEATTGSGAERRAFVDAVQERIKVLDKGPNAKVRSVANIEITYRDTDATRAKEFTDALRTTWIARQEKKLVDRADRELADVTARIGVASKRLVNADKDKQAFERAHDLNPLDWLDNGNKLLPLVTRELQALQGKIDDMVARQTSLKTTVAMLEKQVEKLPQTSTVQKDAGVSPVIQQQIQIGVADAFQQLNRIQAALGNITESHPDYSRLKESETLAKLAFEQAQMLVVTPETVTVENPAYRDALDKLEANQIALSAVDDQLLTLRKRYRERENRVREYRRIQPQYFKLRAEFKAAETSKAGLEREEAIKQKAKSQLTISVPYEIIRFAETPPRPTEPNITLVALAGMAIGLALAIGLVLLIDIVQTTFKTVDDVERLLPLPVLGGMSHMVTPEQRRAVTVRRTRTSLVAGAFLVLMVSVITIYYVAPTRLPPPVRDALGLILGTPTQISPK